MTDEAPPLRDIGLTGITAAQLAGESAPDRFPYVGDRRTRRRLAREPRQSY